jgi:hypothetical protein
MNNLKEKPRETFNTSKLSYPVSEGTVTLNNYLNTQGDLTLASLRKSLAYEENDSLPSMFRTPRAPASVNSGPAGERIDKVIDVPDSPLSHPNIPNTTGAMSPFVAAALFISLAGTAAFQLVGPGPSADREAQNSPPTAEAALQKQPANSQAAVAAFISIPSPGDNEGLQTHSIAPPFSSGTELDGWSGTVETFKQLLAEQRASQGPLVKQTENERVLNQLEAWMNAKTR